MTNKIGGYPITTVVKNLIIINFLFFIATDLLDVFFTSRVGAPYNSLRNLFGLYYFDTSLFKPFQIATSMFTHSGPLHFGLNMLTLFFLGPMIEHTLGSKKFLTLYLFSGIGASVVHTLANYFEVSSIMGQMDAESIAFVQEKGYEVIRSGKNYSNELLGSLNSALHIYAVGASGCISGVLMALGMLYPNVELYFMFIPAPIKARTIAIVSVIGSLVFGILNLSSDPIAHFAHLGGLIFGYLILRFWNKAYLLK